MQFGEERLSLGRLEEDRRHRPGLRFRRGFGQRPLRLPDALARRAHRAREHDRALRRDDTCHDGLACGPARAGSPGKGACRHRSAFPGSTRSPAVGPGSSKRDYDALGIPFEERWKRFDEALAVLRALAQTQNRCPRILATTPSRLTLSWRQPPLDRAVSLYGSGAGAPRPGSRVWRGWATAGLPPPTTRRLSSSPPLALSWPVLSRTGAGMRRASRTRSPRCGPGSRTIEPERSSPCRGPGSRPQARSRGAPRAGLHRTRGALRGAPHTLRRGRMSARLPLAAGRRAATTRVGGKRGSSDDRRELRRRPPGLGALAVFAALLAACDAADEETQVLKLSVRRPASSDSTSSA